MNEQKNHYCFNILVICLLVLCSCKSIPAVVSDTGTGTDQTRTDIATISSGQTELAVTGEKIAGGVEEVAGGVEEVAGTSNRIEGGLGELESAIISGTDTDRDFAAILRKVRERKYSDAREKAGEN